MGEQDKKRKLIWLSTSHVSLVDKGANHGGNKHFFVLKGDSNLTKAREECSKKYGIQSFDGDIQMYPNAPTEEALFGDPVNVKYIFGKEDNKPDADMIKSALVNFKKDHGTYTDADSKARVYERIVRAALSEKIAVEFNSEDQVDTLLPSELKDRLSKQEDGNEDKGTNVPQDEAPPAEDGLADWSVKAQARLDALAWNERLRKLETQQSAKSDTNTQGDAGQDDRVAELTKRSKDAESREAKLKKDNQRIKAELGALKGQVGASFAIRPGSTKTTESSKDDDDGVVTWEEDLGHEVPTNHVAPITR